MMRIKVLKFGGTSVATKNSRDFVIKKIKYAKEDGAGIVAVVSAIGRIGDPYATDTIMTFDPGIADSARIIDEISYENCLRLAYNGAKVIHPRAVIEAQKNPEISFYVRSVFSDEAGTNIGSIPVDDNPRVISITQKSLIVNKERKVKVTIVGNKLNIIKNDITTTLGKSSFGIDGFKLNEESASFYVSENVGNDVLALFHDDLIKKNN